MTGRDMFEGKERQRGLAAVEFAIVLPLMMLLMLATAELGRAFFQYNTLHKAVEDGARYLASHAIPGSTGVIIFDPTVETTVRNLVAYGNPVGAEASLLVGLLPSDVILTVVDGNHVQVSVTYSYTSIFSSIPTFGFAAQDIVPAFNFNASVVMRTLQ